MLTIKRGVQGEMERLKARYVAKGFEQVYGIELFETWAPIGRYSTLRALLSICVVWDLEKNYICIMCAFLNGVLHQLVYIVQPPMFYNGTSRVWKRKKVLHGLSAYVSGIMLRYTPVQVWLPVHRLWRVFMIWNAGLRPCWMNCTP